MKSERVMHLGKVWFVLQIVESGTYNTQSWRPTYRSRREELRVELVVWWFSQVALCAYLLIQESQVIGGEFGHNCIPLICLLGWLCLCGCSIIYFGIFNLYDHIFQLFQHILMYFNCDAEDRDVVSWLMGWFALNSSCGAKQRRPNDPQCSASTRTANTRDELVWSFVCAEQQ